MKKRNGMRNDGVDQGNCDSACGARMQLVGVALCSAALDRLLRLISWDGVVSAGSYWDLQTQSAVDRQLLEIWIIREADWKARLARIVLREPGGDATAMWMPRLLTEGREE